nr:TetR-like C-terminal domain-containing protein [Streptomyces alboflavus]
MGRPVRAPSANGPRPHRSRRGRGPRTAAARGQGRRSGAWYWSTGATLHAAFGPPRCRGATTLPDEEARAAAAASLDVLREAARGCVEAGVLRPDADVDEITDTLWAAAHGVISLERGGHFPDGRGERRFRTLTRAAVNAFLP